MPALESKTSIPVGESAKDLFYAAINGSSQNSRSGCIVESTPKADAPLPITLGADFNTVSKEEVESFLKSKSGSYSVELTPILREALSARSTFELAKKFFEEGFRIVAVPDAQNIGLFAPDSKTMFVGVGDKQFSSFRTLLHELTHYASWKRDPCFINKEREGGADHLILTPILEDRLNILELIKNGRSPTMISERADGYVIRSHGQVVVSALDNGKAGEKINKMLEENNAIALKQYLDSGEMKNDYLEVYDSMLKSKGFTADEKSQGRLGQAMNAELLKLLLQEALDFSKNNNLPINHVWNEAKFQSIALNSARSFLIKASAP